MNKDRRATIEAIGDKLQGVVDKLEDLKSQLETARDQEQEYFDNMAESLQGGEKGHIAENARA